MAQRYIDLTIVQVFIRLLSMSLATLLNPSPYLYPFPCPIASTKQSLIGMPGYASSVSHKLEVAHSTLTRTVLVSG